MVKRDGDLGKTFGFSFSNGSQPCACDNTYIYLLTVPTKVMCGCVIKGQFLSSSMCQVAKFLRIYLPVLLYPGCLLVDCMLTCSLWPLLKLANLTCRHWSSLKMAAGARQVKPTWISSFSFSSFDMNGKASILPRCLLWGLSIALFNESFALFWILAPFARGLMILGVYFWVWFFWLPPLLWGPRTRILGELVTKLASLFISFANDPPPRIL